MHGATIKSHQGIGADRPILVNCIYNTTNTMAGTGKHTASGDYLILDFALK